MNDTLYIMVRDLNRVESPGMTDGTSVFCATLLTSQILGWALHCSPRTSAWPQTYSARGPHPVICVNDIGAVTRTLRIGPAYDLRRTIITIKG